MRVAILAVAVLAVAGAMFHFAYGTSIHAAKVSGTRTAKSASAAHKALPQKSLSLPLFFEANQGQTAPQVKFLARGSGYGLFLTADEAVLNLQRISPAPRIATAPQPSPSSVIRMKLEGANTSATVSGAEPLPGKSNYFIGNDPKKWHHNVPQFARVQYKSVYPGVDLVYYGDQGQLEYDFRVAPAADPSQIALSFTGATTRIDSGKTGDLILSTATGDVRFHAPRVYQPATNQPGSADKTVVGSFRQLADNKIGFTLGDYDHSRELVIDPILSYSTYLGGTGTESLVKIAVDSAGLIYVAGSTNSTDFPIPTDPPANPPIQGALGGPSAQNIFVAVLNTTVPAGNSELLYATYLGGSGTDSLAGIAVSSHTDQQSGEDVYVAGTTTSTDFPTNGQLAPFQKAPQSGTHGFVTRFNLATNLLIYSTYLAGNGSDTITGLAIDINRNAYVTGVTTSSNAGTDLLPFPAKPENAYQNASNAAAGNPQFFASQINTGGTGPGSMLYSTYFGGGYPVGATAIGGGIAVDPPASNNSAVNMYITGTTNMLQVAGPNQEPKFPLRNSYQSCLNESGKTSCSSNAPSPNTDAFVAKINPAGAGDSSLIYSTYLGGSLAEAGVAIAVDTSSNAYVTGSTNSVDWTPPSGGFQSAFGGGTEDAFIAKIGTLNGTIYPLNYFTYLGGNGDDVGQAIAVDKIGGAYVTGSTTSTDTTWITSNTYQSFNAGLQDAFVASISTSSGGTTTNPNGDFSTYLGGSQADQGTGIAIDLFGGTYVAGSTQSPNFPIPPPPAPLPFQALLNGSAPDAFVSKITASSDVQLTSPTTSPSPNPVGAGSPVTFTFDIFNHGPDVASNVNFDAIVPTTGLTGTATATVSSGTCGTVNGTLLPCTIPSLGVCTGAPCSGGGATVTVVLTPAVNSGSTVSVSASVSANGGGTNSTASQTATVDDFTMSASPASQTINAGDTATILVSFKPLTNEGYTGTITPSQTSTGPGGSIVTATAPVFTPTTVTLSGSGTVTASLSIATVARPVTTGSLLRHGSFYATWLPIGGLSLVGLGIGARGKKRRWLAGLVVFVIAGAILLQAGCGSSSNSTNPTGGTVAGRYQINLTGSAGTAAAHTTSATLIVN
jgi:hypothetical protein